MPHRPPTHSVKRLPRRDERPTAHQRGYTWRWQKVRKRYLARHPLCAHCTDPTPATEVDHILPLSRGGAHYDPGNLQALCGTCHRRKTARERTA